ncbi:MAG: LLM class flavin-dependent oxidoreductase [Alphaproteobacteria bacterium]|nr:LLM class flavin-dependent oxidoreductase [Alphaproteobacteria bacterium]
MHFGLFNLMTQRDKNKPARQVYAEMVEHVKLAEQIGFEIAWFAEHHFSNYCLCPSPITMCTYLAPQTRRIKLGPAVIVAPLYEPVRMLEDIAVADTVSDGRLVLGFGSGYQEYEFAKFGVDLKNSRAMFLEMLDVVESYLGAEPLLHQGQYYKIPETYCRVRPIQKRPDIYVAGLMNDPVTQKLIASRGYVPFFTTGWNTLDVIKQTRDKVAASYAGIGGNADETPFAFQQYIYVTDDKSEALRAADGARYIRRVAMSMRGKYGELEGSFLKEIAVPDELPIEEIVRRMIIGSPESCAEKLTTEFAALKPTHVSCFMAIPGMTQKETLRSMERFAGEVLPLIEKSLGPLSRVGAPVPRKVAAE